MEKIQLLELFGGIGSPRCALRNIGVPVKSIDYVEIDEKAVRSYNAMFAAEHEYSPQTVVGWNLKPDILVHGSPCQDFSIAGHQGKATAEGGRINKGKGANEGSGTRSSLMWETVHIIEQMGEWKPKVVIWENVKNVLSKHMVHNFNRYLSYMEKLGYTNNHKILDARNYGLPQARGRVFTVSVLGDEQFNFDLMQTKPMEETDMKDIKWAVLGTGVIANEMAVALKKNGRNIYAVGNRTYDKAVAFAEKYGIGKVYSDFNEMFTDPEVDVIYITTPHNTHIQFMRRAIENGKHILVEKSITLNSDELEEMIKLAEQHNVIIGEAMTIYHMPIYRKLKELLYSGVLGKVNLITMNFGSFKDYDMSNRFFNRNLAGGAMLDIGVYALSFIRWFMDSKPDKLLSQVKPAPTGVDEQAGLLLMNKEGQMATVMLSLHSKQPKRGMVSCENGYIEVMEYPRAWEAKVTYTDTGKTETIAAGKNADALAYELHDMEEAIAGEGSMYLDYTKDVMDMMTAFRKSWGFSYPEEE